MGLAGEFGELDIGNPDGYEKKGDRGEAKGIVVKRKGIAKLGQMGTRGRWPGGDSGKSGGGQFEWSLIRLDSLA
jgi:hypothetical protein